MATVRRAQTRDAAGVTALVDGLGRPPADAEELRAVFLDHLSYDDLRVFVAEEADELAGVVTLWLRPRLNHVTPEAWIADLYVAPAHRRRGLGRALVDAAVAEARRRGCHQLVLQSGHPREEAHLLYEAYGFESVGRHYRLPLG